MKVSLHPGAEADLADALDFYLREAGRSVARRFIVEFERVSTLIARNPGLGSPSAGNRRWFPMQGFPYGVIYRSEDSAVRILVVRHQHRSPAFGAGRR